MHNYEVTLFPDSKTGYGVSVTKPGLKGYINDFSDVETNRLQSEHFNRTAIETLAFDIYKKQYGIDSYDDQGRMRVGTGVSKETLKGRLDTIIHDILVPSLGNYPEAFKPSSIYRERPGVSREEYEKLKELTSPHLTPENMQRMNSNIDSLELWKEYQKELKLKLKLKYKKTTPVQEDKSKPLAIYGSTLNQGNRM